MAILHESPQYHISLISDTPNESGEFVYDMSLNDAEFDQAVDEAEIDEVIENLLCHLFGGGTYYDVSDWCGDGWCHISHDDDTIKIPDISEKIICDEDARCGLLISHDLTSYRWIVVEPAGSVYTG